MCFGDDLIICIETSGFEPDKNHTESYQEEIFVVHQ